MLGVGCGRPRRKCSRGGRTVRQIPGEPSAVRARRSHLRLRDRHTRRDLGAGRDTMHPRRTPGVLSGGIRDNQLRWEDMQRDTMAMVRWSFPRRRLGSRIFQGLSGAFAEVGVMRRNCEAEGGVTILLVATRDNRGASTRCRSLH